MSGRLIRSIASIALLAATTCSASGSSAAHNASVALEAPDGDAQSCAFEAASFASVTISLRPGVGNTTVVTWASGATRNDVLCDVGAGGPAGGSVPNEVVKKRLGELCNKIWSKRDSR
jgi:hypothetical protein